MFVNYTIYLCYFSATVVGGFIVLTDSFPAASSTDCCRVLFIDRCYCPGTEYSTGDVQLLGESRW